MKEVFFISQRVSGNKSGFTRTILNVGVASLSLCLAVIVVSTCLITGFKNEIRDKVFGFWGHIHITHTGSWRSIENLPIDREQDFIFHLDTLEGLSYQQTYSIPLGKFNFELFDRTMHTQGGVKHTNSFLNHPTILATSNDFEGIILKGLGADFDWNFIERYLQKGETIDLKSEEVQRHLILSEQTARRLELDLGDAVIINFIIENQQRRRRMEVKGIYRTGLEEYDRRFALVDMRLIQNILGWEGHQISGFEVVLDHIDDIELFNDYIYLDLLPPELNSEPITRRFPAIFEWLELQNINERVILILMMVVGLITMITSLLILILDRTSMIGVLKSLGATNGTIRKIFLYYGFSLLLKGIIIGNSIGLALCFIQKEFEFLTLNEADYYLAVAPIHFDWFKILLFNSIFIILIMVVLLIPATIISRIDPVKVLRFK